MLAYYVEPNGNRNVASVQPVQGKTFDSWAFVSGAFPFGRPAGTRVYALGFNINGDQGTNTGTASNIVVNNKTPSLIPATLFSCEFSN